MASTATTPQLPPNYRLHVGLPAVPEYRNLRKVAGLTQVTESQALGATKGSWCGCHVRFTDPDDTSKEDAAAVAMGRVVSDGGWYFVIADMAVDPAHQRKGLGSAILKEVMEYIKRNHPEGEPYVTLAADPPGRRLYEKNGFIESEKIGEVGYVWTGSLGGKPVGDNGNNNKTN